MESRKLSFEDEDMPEMDPDDFDLPRNGPQFDNSEDAASLSIPASVSISSQTVRLLPDGAVAVDVSLYIENVVGATNYEVRFV